MHSSRMPTARWLTASGGSTYGGGGGEYATYGPPMVGVCLFIPLCGGFLQFDWPFTGGSEI